MSHFGGHHHHRTCIFPCENTSYNILVFKIHIEHESTYIWWALERAVISRIYKPPDAKAQAIGSLCGLI